MIGGIARYVVGRRLARVLPGGWLAVAVLSPTGRRIAKRAWRRVSSSSKPPPR